MLIPHCICALVLGLHFCVDIFKFKQDLLILFANFYKKYSLLHSHVCAKITTTIRFVKRKQYIIKFKLLHTFRTTESSPVFV